MNKSERIVGIDIIRLMACLFVCIVHFNAVQYGCKNEEGLHDNSVVQDFVLRNCVHLR